MFVSVGNVYGVSFCQPIPGLYGRIRRSLLTLHVDIREL